MIAIQECCATAIRLQGSASEALKWLERDYAESCQLLERTYGEDAKETNKMKLVSEAADWLRSHMTWDGKVRYDLVGKGDVS